MRKSGKIGIVALLLVFLVSSLAFSQNKALSDLQKNVENFSDALAKSLPFTASLGLNWSDAYIGKFLPSVPPHFGVGGSVGFTTIDMTAARDLAKSLGADIDLDMGKLPLPGYAAEGRLGGFFLPFDIGFKFGYLPPVGLLGSGVDMNYTMVGGDIRYELIEGGVLLPKISIGVGLNYLKGGIGTKVGNDITYDFGPDSMTIHSPDVDLMWNTVALDFKVQVSKSFLIVTPYLGLGAGYAWSEAGYEINSNITYSAGKSAEDVKNYLAASGLQGMDFDGNKISSIAEVSGFSVRAFGGLSLNFTVFKLDLTGLYNFRDSNYGASLGARFQL
jgi:hypothetical protein